MFENVDGRRTDAGRTTDAGVTGILIAHLRAFGSGELKILKNCNFCVKTSRFSLILGNVIMDIITFLKNR